MSKSKEIVVVNRLNKLLLTFMSFIFLSCQSPSLAADSTNNAATDAAGPNVPPCISWRNPKLPPRMALLCVHGLGLYSGDYEDFGKRLSRFGVVVYAIDVRGFGSWMKAEGHQDMDFEGCIEDIKNTLTAIRGAHPNLPVFLLGESMGGAIVLRAATTYPNLIDGVISAVPAGDRFKQKRQDIKVAMQFLTGPNKQRSTIGKAVVQQAATADSHTSDSQKVLDKALQENWEQDPLDRLNLSAKDLWQFQKFMNDNYDAVKRLSVPVLFVLGKDDDLVKPDGTWDLFKAVGYHDASLTALPARHLMFEKSQFCTAEVRRATMQTVLGWTNSHVPDKPPADAPVVKVSSATAAQLTNSQPTVIAFYAQWCNQCDKIQRFIDAAQQRSGKLLRLVKIDVDKPENQDLIKEFAIGALPQVVFLTPGGTISSTVIGETNLPVLVRNVAELVANTVVEQGKPPVSN